VTLELTFVLFLAALESYCESRPISQIFWMRLEMRVFADSSFPGSLGMQVPLPGLGIGV
jgi:hypothetical protein